MLRLPPVEFSFLLNSSLEQHWPAKLCPAEPTNILKLSLALSSSLNDTQTKVSSSLSLSRKPSNLDCCLFDWQTKLTISSESRRGYAIYILCKQQSRKEERGVVLFVRIEEAQSIFQNKWARVGQIKAFGSYSIEQHCSLSCEPNDFVCCVTPDRI